MRIKKLFRGWVEKDKKMSATFQIGSELSMLAFDDIMQHTGSTDARGIDIFEGDIVTVDGTPEKIIWFNDGFYTDKSLYPLVEDVILQYRILVIGNEHNNALAGDATGRRENWLPNFGGSSARLLRS